MCLYMYMWFTRLPPRTHVNPQSPGSHALVTVQGYLPANIDRREETLQRKRQEYRNFIDQYYHMRSDPLHVDTFRQVGIHTYMYACVSLCVIHCTCMSCPTNHNFCWQIISHGMGVDDHRVYSLMAKGSHGQTNSLRDISWGMYVCMCVCVRVGIRGDSL